MECIEILTTTLFSCFLAMVIVLVRTKGFDILLDIIQGKSKK